MRAVAVAPVLGLLVLGCQPDSLAQGTARALYTAYFPAGDGLVVEQVTAGEGPAETRTVITYEAENASGPTLEYAHRHGRWFGWSAQLGYATIEVERKETSRVKDIATGTTLSRRESLRSDETSFIPLSGQFDVHLMPPGRFDPYLGLTFGFSWFDEMFGGWVDDHFFYGWSAGLDMRVTERWRIAAVVRFLQVEAEPREGGVLLQGSGEIDTDPWQCAVGVAYQFAPRSK